MKLCVALKVSADYLLTGAAADSDVSSTYDQMRQLNGDQLTDLKQIIELFIKNATK